MAVPEGKKKKPPTFQYLPKTRANRLKKSWIEDHKIRSKWKAQKRREGLTNKSSPPSPTPTPSHDKQSLRDLRRIAYSSKPLPTQKANSSRPKRAPGPSHDNRGGKTTVGRETGQPNMKLRMNFLLEKIKRDFS
ncbi:hypothetical protein OG21DRAFT_495072 [Imleria badia]|nr:hypothetical protein OG21DRAFT_495072 [Imleria badia]